MQYLYSICVFCGASPHIESKYLTLAMQVGKFLAENNYLLIYGGGSVGLMGALANSALKHGGTVTGIYPGFLQPIERIQSIEPANQNLSNLIIVNDLSERKKLMLEKSDAFLILPGGFGTLDEVFEVITWKYLNNLNYPIIFWNGDGYYDKLFEMLEQIYQTKFAADKIRSTYNIVNNMEDLSKILDLETNKIDEIL